MVVMKLRAARDRKRMLHGKCEGRKGYLEVAPEVIARVKRLRRKPKGGKRLTCEQVAEELNKQGMRSLGGYPFMSGLIRKILSTRQR